MVLIALMFTNVPVVLKSPTLTVAALINVANQVLMLYVSSVVKAKSKSAAAINLLVRQQWKFKIGMFVISVVKWHVKIVMMTSASVRGAIKACVVNAEIMNVCPTAACVPIAADGFVVFQTRTKKISP
jgi:hypothetical protein